jgi:hypothetical protein
MEKQDRKHSEGSRSRSSQVSGASIMVRNLGLVGEQVLALQKTEFFRRKPGPAQIGGGEEEQRDEGSSIGYSCKDTLFLDSSAPLRLESVLNFMGSKSSTPRENPRVLLASTGSIEDSARTPLESPKEANVITASPRKLFLSPSHQNYQLSTEQQYTQSSSNTAQKAPLSPQVGLGSKPQQSKGASAEKIPPPSPFINARLQQFQKKRVWMEIIPKVQVQNSKVNRGNSGEALVTVKQSTNNTSSSGNLAWRNSVLQQHEVAKKSAKTKEEKPHRPNQEATRASKPVRTPIFTEKKILNRPAEQQKSAMNDLPDQKGQQVDSNPPKPRLRLSKSMRIDLSTEELKLSMQSSVLGSTMQFTSPGNSKLESDYTGKTPLVPTLKNVGINNLQKIPEEPPLPQSARRSSKKKAVEGMSLREMLLQKEKQEILHSMMKKRQISPAPPVKTNFGCWAFQQLKDQKDRQGLKNVVSQKNAMVEYFTDKDHLMKRSTTDNSTAAAKPSKSSTLKSELLKTDRANSSKPAIRTSSRASQTQKKQPRL